MDSSAADGLPADTRRERNFRFSLFSESVFDRGASSKLNYGEGAGNGPLFGGMRDEVSLCVSPEHLATQYYQCACQARPVRWVRKVALCQKKKCCARPNILLEHGGTTSQDGGKIVKAGEQADSHHP